MRMNTLHDYVKLVLEKFVKPRQRGVKKFNYDDFMNAEDQELYLDLIFASPSEGSSRRVFILNSKKVLKYAYNEKGRAQNRAEWTIFTKAKNPKHYAKIYWPGDNFGFLVSELVRPISDEEFEDRTGCDIEHFGEVAKSVEKNELKSFAQLEPWRKAVVRHMIDLDEPREKIGAFSQAIKGLQEKGREVFDIMFDAIQSKLAAADLGVAEHYGVASDGRLVLLDYGYTLGVWSKYYAGQNRTVEDNTNYADEEALEKGEILPTEEDPELEAWKVKDTDWEVGRTTQDKDAGKKVKTQAKRDQKNQEKDEETA